MRRIVATPVQRSSRKLPASSHKGRQRRGLSGRVLVAISVIMLSMASLPPVGATHDGVFPDNDVPLDLERGLPLLYPSMTIVNVFWDSDWNSHNSFTMSAVNSRIEALIEDSDYFSRLHQYDSTEPELRYGGSVQAKSEDLWPCSSHPGATTNSPATWGFLLCMELFDGEMPKPGGIPIPWVAGSPGLMPNPTGDHIYNVILPEGTNIDDFGHRSCTDYAAYHFMVHSYGSLIPLRPPGRPIYYTVIPAECAGDVDGLIELMTHEIVEAYHNPLPMAHWTDTSTLTGPQRSARDAVESSCAGDPLSGDFDYGGCLSALIELGLNSLALAPGQLEDLFSAGEAADMCANRGFGSVPYTAGGTTMSVQAFWSNSDNACVAGSRRVVHAEFEAVNRHLGTPLGRGRVNVDGVDHRFSGSNPTYTQVVLEGVAYDFPDEVIGVASGARYLRQGPCSDTITFPVGNTTGDAAVSIQCDYQLQWPLSVLTHPPEASIGNLSLTPSGWYDFNSTVKLTADEHVTAGVGSRYESSGWFPLSIITMDAAKTATAVYQLQHLVKFHQTGLPDATPWSVTVDDTKLPGPTSIWVDDGEGATYAYETPVPDASDPMTRYVLKLVSPPELLVVDGPSPVEGIYWTEHLLSVATTGLSGEATTVRNGATELGKATDSSPLEVFLRSGTPIDLGMDDPVHGSSGIEYFLVSFDPQPPSSLGEGFATTATYATMAEQIDEALAGGDITVPAGRNVAHALGKKFSNAQNHLGNGEHSDALDDLESFIALLRAQSGKKVAPALSSALRLDAADVYHYALCRAHSSGQLDDAAYADRYDFYAEVVTSLGEIPEPDC